MKETIIFHYPLNTKANNLALKNERKIARYNISYKKRMTNYYFRYIQVNEFENMPLLSVDFP